MKISPAPNNYPSGLRPVAAAGAGVQFVGANWFRHRPTVPSCMPRMAVGLVKTTRRKHQKPTTALSVTLVNSTSLRAWQKLTKSLLGSPSLPLSQPDNTVSGSRLNRMVEVDGCAGYQPATPKKHVIQRRGVERWTRVQLPARPPTFATGPRLTSWDEDAGLSARADDDAEQVQGGSVAFDFSSKLNPITDQSNDAERNSYVWTLKS